MALGTNIPDLPAGHEIKATWHASAVPVVSVSSGRGAAEGEVEMEAGDEGGRGERDEDD